MSELDRFQEMLEKTDRRWVRVRSLRTGGDAIQGYIDGEFSWVVFEEGNDGLITYADPCDSAAHKTAEYIFGFMEANNND